jgi:hypothetical protein
MLSLGILLQKHAEREKLLVRIASNEGEMGGRWDEAIDWLLQKGFLRPDDTMPSGFLLLPRGRACAAFADGQPVVVGTVIADGYLEGLSFGEICAWISLFLRETRVKDCSKQGLVLPTASPKLQAACRFSDTLLDQLSAELRIDRSDGNAYTYADFLACYGQQEGIQRWDTATVKQRGTTQAAVLDRALGLLVLDWVEQKDIKSASPCGCGSRALAAGHLRQEEHHAHRDELRGRGARGGGARPGPVRGAQRPRQAHRPPPRRPRHERVAVLEF